MTRPALPPLVMTCGEPAGIGLEIAVAAHQALAGTVPFALICDPSHLPAGTAHTVISDLAQVGDTPALAVLPHRFAAPNRQGTPDPANAQGVIDVIARAVDLVQSGAASGIVTCPIHKKALLDGAAFAYPGHTEYLAALAGGTDVVMMLASDTLRVVPATIHIAIAEVPRTLTADLLERCLRVTHAGLVRDFAIPAPRIAVAGLNPHAGEGGAMGHEEGHLIAPLLDRLRDDGLDLTGPMSADTMFHAAARARYDAAVCMYHDQALIPIKTLDFDRGVNVTLGLPFIRTSPDHGTAFDIAGTGRANPASLIEAVRMAHRMAQARTQTP